MELYSRQKAVAVELLDQDRLRAEATMQDNVHEITVRLEYDLGRQEIVAADVEFIRFPWDVCAEVAGLMDRLIGKTIGRGLRREVQSLVGGCDGCSHVGDLVMEALLGIIQAQYRIKYQKMSPKEREEAVKSDLKSTCRAYTLTDRKPIPRGQWVRGAV